MARMEVVDRVVPDGRHVGRAPCSGLGAVRVFQSTGNAAGETVSALNGSAARQRVRVRGYWRRSTTGVVHHVAEHVRSGLAAGERADEHPPSHSGQDQQGADVGANGLVKPRSAPWVEVRYLVRYVGVDGRKHSAFIPRRVGEAWRKRSARAGAP